MAVHSHYCPLYNRQLLDAADDAIEEKKSPNWPRVFVHLDEQDTSLPGWAALQQLIEDAAKDGREKFSPRGDLGHELWSQIVTLPESIATLKRVKVFDLYGSPLLRIPPEIGRMESLEEFDPYTSYGLHWYPYEITQCKQLRKSRVSTRALYGNYKFRPSFPGLDPVIPQLISKQCSVCGTDLAGREVLQRWLSLCVATDILPLLVNACSEECIGGLPEGAAGYIQSPHMGGPKLKQPIELPNRRKIYIAGPSGQESAASATSGSGQLKGLSELPLFKAQVPAWKAEELRKQREALDTHLVEVPPHLRTKLGPEMKMGLHWVDVKLSSGLKFYNLAVRGGRFFVGLATDTESERKVPFASEDVIELRRHMPRWWPVW